MQERASKLQEKRSQPDRGGQTGSKQETLGAADQRQRPRHTVDSDPWEKTVFQPRMTGHMCKWSIRCFRNCFQKVPTRTDYDVYYKHYKYFKH